MGQSDQTFISFRDKWEKNTQLAFAETLNEGSDIFQWILSAIKILQPLSVLPSAPMHRDD